MGYLDKNSFMLQVDEDAYGRRTLSIQIKLRTKEDPNMYRMVGVSVPAKPDKVDAIWKILSDEKKALELEAGLLGV